MRQTILWLSQPERPTNMPSYPPHNNDLSSQRLLSDDNEDEHLHLRLFSPESLPRKDGIFVKIWRSWTALHVTLICVYSAIYLGLILYRGHAPAATTTNLLPCKLLDYFRSVEKYIKYLLTSTSAWTSGIEASDTAIHHQTREQRFCRSTTARARASMAFYAFQYTDSTASARVFS